MNYGNPINVNYIEHFNKYRSLSVVELYDFLSDNFREYIYYSSFVVYIKPKSSLHIPRSVFSGKVKGLCILPILIIDKSSSHFNILIIDNTNRIVERFEPSDSFYDADLNRLLKMAFYDNKFHYIYAKHIGPQFMEIKEVGVTMNCGFWVLLYTQERIRNFSLKQKQFIQKWMYDISKRGFHNWIIEYKRHVLEICSKNTSDSKYKYIYERIYNRRPLDYYDYKLNII